MRKRKEHRRQERVIIGNLPKDENVKRKEEKEKSIGFSLRMHLSNNKIELG